MTSYFTKSVSRSHTLLVGLLIAGALQAGCASIDKPSTLAFDAAWQEGNYQSAASMLTRIEQVGAGNLADRRDREQFVQHAASRYRTQALSLLNDGQDEALASFRQMFSGFGRTFASFQRVDTEVEQAQQARVWSVSAEKALSGEAASDCKAALRAFQSLPVGALNPSVRRSRGQLEQRCGDVEPARPKLPAHVAQRPITLELRQAPLSAVLSVFSEQLGAAFIADPSVDVSSRVNVSAKEQPVGAVVGGLLQQMGLIYRVDELGNVLISPKGDPRTLSAESEYAVLQFKHADPKFIADSLRQLSPIKDFVIDDRLKAIYFSGPQNQVEQIRTLVRVMDTPTPEVMLEVEIFEVKRSKLQELGLRPPGQISFSALPGNDDVLTLRELRRINADTTKVSLGDAQINLRSELQDGEVLANPRIRVRNKEKARVLIGDRVPIITTTSTSTGFVSESVNYVDVGIKLEVSPEVNPDRQVAIKIDLDVSSINKETLTKSGSLSYQIGTRSASTSLQLNDGETQVLAGLISDEERSSNVGLPWLGSIPVLGRLFSSKKDDGQRSEILLSITPRVITPLEVHQK